MPNSSFKNKNKHSMHVLEIRYQLKETLGIQISLIYKSETSR